MAGLNHLPIWRDATRLLLAIEQAVRGFPRYHKFVGSAVRTATGVAGRLLLLGAAACFGTETVRTADPTHLRAANHREDQLRHLGRLVDAVDDLKLQGVGSAVRTGANRGPSTRRFGRGPQSGPYGCFNDFQQRRTRNASESMPL
jgi:hypothetical protein